MGFDTSEVKVKNFTITAGATDQELVAAVASKVLRMIAFKLSMDANADITLEDNAGTPKVLFKEKDIKAIVLDRNYFDERTGDTAESGSGKNIRIDVSGTANGEGRIHYVEET